MAVSLDPVIDFFVLLEWTTLYQLLEILIADFPILCYSTACLKLEEYYTSKEALEKGASLAQNDSRFTKLIEECDKHIAGMCLFQFRL